MWSLPRRYAWDGLISCLALQTISQLEEATGGYVMHQSGRTMFLYRGPDWIKPPAAAQPAQQSDGEHRDGIGQDEQVEQAQAQQEQQEPGRHDAADEAAVQGTHDNQHQCCGARTIPAVAGATSLIAMICCRSV